MLRAEEPTQGVQLGAAAPVGIFRYLRMALVIVFAMAIARANVTMGGMKCSMKMTEKRRRV
jgi:hypothetical protein